MTDPVISRFAQACGATGPLDLRVGLADGGVLAEGSVPMPFCLVGRDDACDVTLTDAEVNPRHAWLQVVGGRVFAVDLGSRTGLRWPSGVTGSGWLDVDVPAKVGPFQLRLRSPVAPRPVAFPHRYSPLQSDPACVRSLANVALEFRNGKREKDRWTVNRLVTLIGRAPECKIHLTAEDIGAYHCGLVLTSDGLWVVDLSGRGVVVNGERMRVSPLPHGAELWVGRFLVGIHGQVETPTPRRNPAVPLATPVATQPGEDEVPLGIVPPHDPASGLPSSHIMADAFRTWGDAKAPLSNPILVGGSGPTPDAVPVPATRSVSPIAMDLIATPPPGMFGRAPVEMASPVAVSPDNPADAIAVLLRQLAETHSQMFTQGQTLLVLLVQLFRCLRHEQLPGAQRELLRIQELNAELADLHGEVVRRAVESLPMPRAETWVSTSTPTPLPDQLPPRPPSRTVSLPDWVVDRVNTLQLERQIRWRTLLGMFSGDSA